MKTQIWVEDFSCGSTVFIGTTEQRKSRGMAAPVAEFFNSTSATHRQTLTDARRRARICARALRAAGEAGHGVQCTSRHRKGGK